MVDFNFQPIQKGWECPKCKRIYSPTQMMCIACPSLTQGGSPSTGTAHICTSFVSTMDGKSKYCDRCGKSKDEHPFLTNL